jgi:hypothetical protein
MVVGGWGAGRLRSTEFYNPETADWTLAPPMSIPREDHTQTPLRWDRHAPLEFKVLVAGGTTTDSVSADSAELFTSGEVNV